MINGISIGRPLRFPVGPLGGEPRLRVSQLLELRVVSARAAARR